MAKIVRMTEEDITRLKEEFAEALRNLKLADGKVSYSKDFGKIEKKAKLYFTEVAWLKQSMLINEFDKEVAWHGVAKRGDKPGEYVVEDILVYPQEVTGSTVTTDQTKYQTWLFDHPDEVFNNIRMQGHSHVNMGTTPSSVDTSLYERLLGQLDDTMFYIFLIFNKRGEKTIKIYDMRDNVLYETADVEIEVLDEGYGFGKFVEDAKSMVVAKTYQPTAYSGNYSGYQYNKQPNTVVANTPIGNAAKNQSTVKPSESGLKKGKKKKGYGGSYYKDWSERWDDEGYYNDYGWYD